MTETVVGLLDKYMSPELVVFIISMLPILELRGGLIAASLLDIPWVTAMIISVIGTILPIPFILLFIKRVLQFMIKKGIFKGFAIWLRDKGMRKGEELSSRHPRRMQLGLFLFVAIPLPGTGGWTGALIASLLGMRIKASAPAIVAGVIGAGVIMSILAYLVPSLIGLK